MTAKPIVIILSVSSDIGLYLAKRYLQDGFRVVGTYRSSCGSLFEMAKSPDCILFYCDISNKKGVRSFLESFKKLRVHWNLFISCVGDLRPCDDFFQADFDAWSNSIHINSIEQLRVIHGLYPLRNEASVSSVVFFAGGGVNNAVPHLSAYITSKIMLIKMCELLDAENADLNIFIIGPGFIKTKIHKLVKMNIVPEEKKETNIENVYKSINWLISQGKNVAGGRNFSITHDSLYGDKGKILARELLEDRDMYKLRRHKNNFSVD